MKLTAKYSQDSNTITLYFPEGFDTSALADGSVTSNKLADDSVITAKIADVAVITAHLQDSLVTAAKIANLAVDDNKLADLAVTAGKLSQGAIATISDRDGICQAQTIGGAGDLTLNGTFVSVGVATLEVVTAVGIYSAGNLSALTFTVYGTDMSGNIQNAPVTGPNNSTVYTSIGFKTITRVAVNGAVATAAEVGISFTAIRDDAVGTQHIQDLAVGTAQIGLAAIGSAQIGSAAIGTAHIQNAAVGSAAIASLAVGTGQIADLAITTAKIANATISTAKIANLAVTNALINDLHGSKITASTITGDKISATSVLTALFQAGSGHTPSSRAFEITSAGVNWSDNLISGSIVSENSYYNSYAAVKGVTYGAVEGVIGQVYSGNTSASAHGLRGINSYRGSSGLIGAANNYDFYADGSGTNYGPFTGAHDALIPLNSLVEIGDIVIDIKCIERRNLSNTIFEVAQSTKANQIPVGILVNKRVIDNDQIPAAFISHMEEIVTLQSISGSNEKITRSKFKQRPTSKYAEVINQYYIGAINALGEGQMYVCGESGDIEAGDLIVTSSTPGKGMKQADNIVRSITVAKARENVIFSKSSEEIKIVACIYMCG